MDECIGCGYCCRKAPCLLSLWDADERRCDCLKWDGHRWRCALVEDTVRMARRLVVEYLAIGEGCCSNMNTYRVKRYVPTPEDLKNEDECLSRLRRLDSGESGGAKNGL